MVYVYDFGFLFFEPLNWIAFSSRIERLKVWKYKQRVEYFNISLGISSVLNSHMLLVTKNKTFLYSLKTMFNFSCWWIQVPILHHNFVKLLNLWVEFLLYKRKISKFQTIKKEDGYKCIFLKLASYAILRIGWNTTARRPEYEVVRIELCSIKK